NGNVRAPNISRQSALNGHSAARRFSACPRRSHSCKVQQSSGICLFWCIYRKEAMAEVFSLSSFSLLCCFRSGWHIFFTCSTYNLIISNFTLNVFYCSEF
ncbi:hypothetical protein L9F63_017154, partial [Diploptera punctata]